MTTVTRGTVSAGEIGSRETLARMRDIVNRSLSVPLVNETALGIAGGVPSRDYLGMAHAIRSWMATHFQFVPDPVGVELLRDPEYQLRQWMTYGKIRGDCDDAAILGAALAKSVGIQARFRAVGFNAPGAPLVHVYTLLTGPAGRVTRYRVNLDVTRPAGTNAKESRCVELSV